MNDDRVDHDRVGDREEADRAGAEHQRGHGDERVRGVQVAAEQEPADERAEAAAAEPPLVQVHHVLGPAPAGRGEADAGDDEEEDDDDRERDGVDVAHLRHLGPALAGWPPPAAPASSAAGRRSTARCADDRHVGQQVEVEEREVADLRGDPGVDRHDTACQTIAGDDQDGNDRRGHRVGGYGAFRAARTPWLDGRLGHRFPLVEEAAFPAVTDITRDCIHGAPRAGDHQCLNGMKRKLLPSQQVIGWYSLPVQMSLLETLPLHSHLMRIAISLIMKSTARLAYARRRTAPPAPAGPPPPGLRGPEDVALAAVSSLIKGRHYPCGDGPY